MNTDFQIPTRHADRSGLQAVELFKALSDSTRLQAVLLMHQETELCVCELTEALSLSQPMISRHLATLRKTGVVEGRRHGQWVYYRLADNLPEWARQVVAATAADQMSLLEVPRYRLAVMQDRPDPCC